MRCSICGAKLRKAGDICTTCYKAYQEEEDLKKDKKEVFKIRRKYSIPYEVVKYCELYLIFVISAIGCWAFGNIAEGFLCFLIMFLILGVIFFWDKRIAMATKATFYEKKVVYKFDFLFIHIERVVKYTDITDVTYYQKMRQKRYGFGDLCFYAKGPIPGATLLNGFQIKNVEDVEGTLDKIGEIVGPYLVPEEK